MNKAELRKELIFLGEDPEELKDYSKRDLEILYDDITDTSGMHPNETYEEFMEHEDY